MMELDIFELMIQRDFYNICISLSIFLCAFFVDIGKLSIISHEGKSRRMEIHTAFKFIASWLLCTYVC